MVKPASFWFTRSSLIVLAFMLGGCLLTLPDSIVIVVFNDPDLIAEDGGVSACLGGVKASISLNGKTVTTGLTQPQPHSDPATGRAELMVPPSARTGDRITTKAWCYATDGAEVGYARSDTSLRPVNIPLVHVLAPIQNKPLPEGSGCVKLTEQRGVRLCITGDFYP